MSVGLCLAGGGGRGAYQIGAAMALKEANILDKVDYIAGTSIGSVNAVLLACLPVEKVKDLWFSIPHDVLKSSESFFKRVRKETIHYIKNGVYSLDYLKKLVKNNVDFDLLKQKRVFVTLSDCGNKKGGLFELLKATTKHYIIKDNHALYSKTWEHTRSEVLQHVMASCSIPVAFNSQKINGKQYFDGGLYDNVPVKPLIEAGCTEIFVILLDKLPYFYKHRYEDIFFHTIRPKKSLGAILNFDANQSVIRYNYGYEDMMHYLKENHII